MKFVLLLALAMLPSMAFASETGADLSDLQSLTFTCPRAGLNAAAKEAAKAPTAGTYQFTYFKLVSSTAQSFYEVGFKSNVSGEPDLNYSVSLYCQSGVILNPIVTRH